ncbi:hypothetical protein KOW79_009016 [Hemibagrus wyckioides]|uniref:3CxxC-type domain-containing protein n=1 Tax=Hemibagrus wyckioides TaxID=337641 RepID=A0A9D3SKZ8_9TELE|nr:receptor-transporting protein 4-like [Hemibagrus wyckioides]KAG7327410.1 hypothetical protein KOW79_009016 [Hemibagrus wyckioides]
MEDQWMSVFRTRAGGLQDKWTLRMDDSIQPQRPDLGFFEYMKGSFAEFRCSGCGHRWASKRVMVVFHYSRDAASVKARRCKQECRRCNGARNEMPTFSHENIDVMVEKLIEKIKIRCYGENTGKSNRASRFFGNIKGPHENAHCEACQLGICQQGT